MCKLLAIRNFLSVGNEKTKFKQFFKLKLMLIFFYLILSLNFDAAVVSLLPNENFVSTLVVGKRFVSPDTEMR